MEQHVLHRSGGTLVPYQKYIDRGYFEVVTVTQDTPNGTKVYTQTKVTAEGLVWLAKKLNSGEVIEGENPKKRGINLRKRRSTKPVQYWDDDAYLN